MGHRVTADWAWTTRIKTLSPIKSNEYDFLKGNSSIYYVTDFEQYSTWFLFLYYYLLLTYLKNKTKLEGLGH